MIIITDLHYKAISKAIQDYSGIVLDRIPRQRVEKKILETMTQMDCHNIDLFVDLMMFYQGSSQVIDSLINEITISETYIFRNHKQFEYLIFNFFPEFFMKKQFKFPLRIWSAGCSQGEEAYSIAMIARDFQLKNPNAKFSINAGDINRSSLQKAKQAIYGKSSFRGNIEFFEEHLGFSIGSYDQNNNCKISEDLRKMVDFQWLNLKNLPNLKIMHGSDIIFCRNVLVYFDEALRSKLLKTFYECLNPGGLLFIGESECFPFPSNSFEPVNFQGCYAYKKPEK